MTDTVICDGCGEPIDQSISYYTAHINVVQMLDGVLTSGGSPVKRDWHTEHLPQGLVTDDE
jgi:hypothetical protein